MHLKEQTQFPVFTDWFWQAKTFVFHFPRLMKLPPESKLSWDGAMSFGYCYICNGVHNLWACYQGIRWVWVLSGFWVDRTDSRTSGGLALGQGSALELAYSKPITRCRNECRSHQIPGRAPAGSLGKWDGPWTVIEKDWNYLSGLFRIHSQDRCLQTWFWRDG